VLLSALAAVETEPSLLGVSAHRLTIARRIHASAAPG
jgi:hypothetical protein